ncbi:MAG TPA: ATP synthase F0 subunit B [Candidatus Limivicinus faecipullorum]|nr:ATP synthase F0 subunit B [Candidatus Limivicinus faecipullorum]
MLTINISELLLTVLSFFILMFLLNKLLFKPVISFREQRQKGIDDCFEQERQAKEKLAETQKDLDCRRSESLKQAESIMADARSKAQQEAENIAKQAESQAEEKMQQAAREAEELRKAGGEALEEQRRQLAADLADRLCR